jgi:hypothetical protein
MERCGLNTALALDIIVPAYEVHNLKKGAGPGGGSVLMQDVSESNRELLHRLRAAPTGRGISSSTARFRFPYTRIPLWVMGVGSHASATSAIVPAEQSNEAAAEFFAQALAARQFLTVGRGVSKILHRYSAPLLQDSAAIALVIAATAIQNLWGLVALVLAGTGLVAYVKMVHEARYSPLIAMHRSYVQASCSSPGNAAGLFLR